MVFVHVSVCFMHVHINITNMHQVYLGQHLRSFCPSLFLRSLASFSFLTATALAGDVWTLPTSPRSTLQYLSCLCWVPLTSYSWLSSCFWVMKGKETHLMSSHAEFGGVQELMRHGENLSPARYRSWGLSLLLPSSGQTVLQCSRSYTLWRDSFMRWSNHVHLLTSDSELGNVSLHWLSLSLPYSLLPHSSLGSHLVKI